MHGALLTRSFRGIGMEGGTEEESIGAGARGLPTGSAAVFAQVMSVADGSAINHSLDS